MESKLQPKNVACQTCKKMYDALREAQKQYEMLNEGERETKKIELKAIGKVEVDFTIENYMFN